jgi:hypothetical protein
MRVRPKDCDLLRFVFARRRQLGFSTIAINIKPLQQPQGHRPLILLILAAFRLMKLSQVPSGTPQPGAYPCPPGLGEKRVASFPLTFA